VQFIIEILYMQKRLAMLIKGVVMSKIHDVGRTTGQISFGI